MGEMLFPTFSHRCQGRFSTRLLVVSATAACHAARRFDWKHTRNRQRLMLSADRLTTSLLALMLASAFAIKSAAQTAAPNVTRRHAIAWLEANQNRDGSWGSGSV